MDAKDIKVTFLTQKEDPLITDRLTPLLKVFTEKQTLFQEAEKQLKEAKHNLFQAFVEDQVKKRNLLKHIEAFAKRLPKNVVLKKKDAKRKFFLEKPTQLCSACQKKTESKILRSWFSNQLDQIAFNVRYGDLIVSKEESETLILTDSLCVICAAFLCDRISSVVDKQMKSICIQNPTGFGKTIEGDDLTDTEIIYQEMVRTLIV